MLNPRKHLETVFLEYPMVALWRLLMHGYKQETEGPGVFEKEEPGYLRGMFTGLNEMMRTLDEPLSVSCIINLHDACIHGVTYHYRVSTEEGIQDDFESFSRGLRKRSGTEFGLVANEKMPNCSRAGIIELLQKIASGDSYLFLRDSNHEKNIDCSAIPTALTDEFIDETIARLKARQYYVSINVTLAGKLKERLEGIIKEYHQQMAGTISSDEKIKAIATVIHELELTHPFSDGNCRTFALIVLNKLLLQQGLTPVILEDPDRFDAYSIEELSLEIRHGMDRFRAVDDEGYKDDSTLIYLKNNRAVSYLVALEILSGCDHWDAIQPSEKTRALAMVREVLTTMEPEGVNATQLAGITKSIRENLNQAIYLKSWYQYNFFRTNQEYGIYFKSLVNQYFNPQFLDLENFSAMARV